MAIRKILTYPDPFLRKPTERVDFKTLSEPLWESDIQDMYDTLYGSDRGAAMAANQIGLKQRFFVINKNQTLPKHVPLTIVNPEILSKSSETTVEHEGCLSFPGISVPVRRSRVIEVAFQYAIDGQHEQVELQDWIARVFQHEIDHLDGKLFVDELSTKKRVEIAKTIMKGGR